MFYVVPFCQVVWDSFCVGAGRNQVFAGFSNYERMFQNDMFLLAFGNSLRFLAIGLPAIMVLSYALALFLRSLAKRYSLLRTALLLPYVMPVAGYRPAGWIFSSPRKAWPMRPFWPWGSRCRTGSSPRRRSGVMLLLYLWKSTGYSVVLLLAGAA